MKVFAHVIVQRLLLRSRMQLVIPPVKSVIRREQDLSGHSQPCTENRQNKSSPLSEPLPSPIVLR